MRAVGIEPVLWTGGPVDAALLWTPKTEAAPVVDGTPQVLTLHDVNPLRRGPRRGPSRWLHAIRYRRDFRAALPAAAGLAAVSADAAAAAERAFPGRLPVVGVVPHFPAACFFPPTAAEIEAMQIEHGLQPGFVLYVSALRRHKNWEALVRAWAALSAEVRAQHPLVLVGGHRGAEQRLAALRAEFGLNENQPRLLSGLSDDALRCLYGSCGLFVFPSFLEGFGLPPLEAMACGAPVLAANTTSIPEVLGDAAAYFNPWVSRELGEQLAKLLAVPARRAQMKTASVARAAEFHPRRTGEAFLALCERLDLDG